MKKLLLGIGALVLTMSSYAQQSVPIVWPFAPGSNQANFVRAIVEEANKQQTKYLFHFENKPGAGGSIAANYVSNYNGIALLSSSSSFFVRPVYYPNESHKVSDFTPVIIQCTGQPFVVVSAKYKTLAELRTQPKLTIGATLGSLTEAVGRELKNNLPASTDLAFIGYNNTIQPTQEMIGGVLDLNVDVPASTLQWIETGKINVVGSSGTVDFPNYRTFHSQGIKGFENLVSNYQIVASAKADPAVVTELHAILRKASKDSERLATLYKNDYCAQTDVDLKTANSMYDRWSKNWTSWLKKTF
jgi:tripartite-type tricarboxylate transporter receptor subunit TctC